MNFWEWFDKIRGDTSIRQIERWAHIPHGRISNAYRKRQPTQPIAEAIADGLGLPQDDVFRQAGWLSPKLDDLRAADPDLDRTCRTVADLPEPDRSVIFRIVAALGQDHIDRDFPHDKRQLRGFWDHMTDEEQRAWYEELKLLVEGKGVGGEKDELAGEQGVEFGES